MTYTLGDIDWEKFQSKYGFGGYLDYADIDPVQVADGFKAEGNLIEDPDNWDQFIRDVSPWHVYEVSLYNLPDDLTEEDRERLASTTGGIHPWELSDYIQETGLEPVDIISQKVIYVNAASVWDEYIFNNDAVEYYVGVGSYGSSAAQDLPGYFAEGYPYADGTVELCDMIAEKNNVDAALFTKTPSEADEKYEVRKLIKTVSFEEAIASGCGSKN